MSAIDTTTFGGVLELVRAVEEAFREMPCAWSGYGCKSPATILAVSPCSHEVPMCTGHAKSNAAAIEACGVGRCRTCLATFAPSAIRWVPLS